LRGIVKEFPVFRPKTAEFDASAAIMTVWTSWFHSKEMTGDEMIFLQIQAEGDRNFSYLIADGTTGEAAIVDPSYAPEKALAESVDLEIRYVISTHSHPDHVAGNAYILERTGAEEVLHESSPHASNLRVKDNDELLLGALHLRFLHTPGHIPDHVCVLVENHLLTGDLLFVGKVGGTGPHFKGSDPRQQWDSLQRLMRLAPSTRIWPGHDYGAKPNSTIGNEVARNPFLLCASYEEFLHLKATWAEYKKLHNIE
jgi:hydroxyacylglutathione hydrolase